MNRVLVIGATGKVGRQVLSQLPATGAQVRALTRNRPATRLPPQVEVVRGDLTLPETLDECRMASMRCSWCGPPRRRASRGAVQGRTWPNCTRLKPRSETALWSRHRIPLISVQNGAPLLPRRAAQSGRAAAPGNRAADRNLRPPVDVPAARNVRRECPVLVGAADPRRRRYRALAPCRRSYNSDPRA